MNTNETSGYTLWNAALYVRVSPEEKKQGTYDSISNQIKILKEHAQQKNIVDVEVFEDDCQRGGTFDRPAFKRMIRKIEEKQVNCVIVKDLSRFGRDYSECGYYIEKFFPSHSVRFISKLERLDSYIDPQRINSIELPLINIMNDQYLTQVSNATKVSLKIKRKEGKFVGAIVPYGYKRSSEDKYKLIVDEIVRANVEYIFHLYLNNYSMNHIANILMSKDVLTPSQYRQQQKGLDVKHNSVWDKQKVRRILTQEILTGDMVQGKTISYSHKVKKREPLPRDKWNIVENTHEAIIDKETFNRVQTLLTKKVRPKSIKEAATKPSVLSGYVVCGDCGQKMVRTTSIQNGEKYYYFRCKTNKTLGNDTCSSRLISEDTLLEVLKTTINTIITSMIDFNKLIHIANEKELNMLKSKLEIELKKLLTKQKKVLRAKSGLYSDYREGIISLDDYRYMSKEFDDNYNSISDKIGSLKKELCNLKSSNTIDDDITEKFLQYQNTNLTRSMIIDLVDMIIVTGYKSIKIKCNFENEIKKYLKIDTDNNN